MVKALLDCWWIKVERIVSQINQYVVWWQLVPRLSNQHDTLVQK
jgi:hypothetical protein